MDHNNPSDIVMLLKSYHLVLRQEPVRSRLTSFVSSRLCTSKPAFKHRSSAGENLWTIHICKHYSTAYWTELHDNSMKYFSIILPVMFQMRLRPDVKTIFFSQWELVSTIRGTCFQRCRGHRALPCTKADNIRTCVSWSSVWIVTTRPPSWHSPVPFCSTLKDHPEAKVR